MYPPGGRSSSFVSGEQNLAGNVTIFERSEIRFRVKMFTMNTSTVPLHGKDVPEASANEEVWKDIPGYEGLYQVSQRGNLRSLYPVKKGQPPLVMRQQAYGSGLYKHSRLYKDKKDRAMAVHRLVMLAFVGPRPEGFHTCHCDGDHHNNHLSNLRYDTPSGNVMDSVRQGRWKAKVNARKLTEEQATEVLKSTAPTIELSRMYGLTPPGISRIRLGRTWPHLYRQVMGRDPVMPVSQGKLTEAQVVEIINSPLGCQRLSRQYGVSSTVIKAIRKRKIWRHVQA
jgi:hypothetical protein